MNDTQNYRMEILGCIGHPIDENPTAVMIAAAFNNLKLNHKYLMIDVDSSALADAITGVKAFKMLGLNVTVPHKVNVIKYLDELDPLASMIGAVNTIVNDHGRLIGYNTDGLGFLQALNVNGIDITGKDVVILGAGGAARAIAFSCLTNGIHKIHIINRSSERGLGLVKSIRSAGGLAEFLEFVPGIKIPNTNIIVNATEIGMYPSTEIPPIDFDCIYPGQIVCDVIINPPMTSFLRVAKSHGATIVDGLGMLVYQGARGIELWTGKYPSTNVMKESLLSCFETLN